MTNDEQQRDELRGLARHTANCKAEVARGIMGRSEFNPKLAKHAQCATPLLFQITRKESEICYPHAVENQDKPY